jgi:diketogulonate reductase-like aldo/keto reductase
MDYLSRHPMEYKSLGQTGIRIPVLGLGTWGLGFSHGGDFLTAVSALRHGIDLGLTLIDTAESYGSGRSESIVGEAIKDRRHEVFIATKINPSNLAYDDVIQSAEKSLRRLGTNYIDLYQIHFPNPRIPIKETMRAMEHLIDAGKIRFVGVSNFSVQETQEAQEALSKVQIVSNQIEYSPLDRSIEQNLMPYCQRERITVIAYTPLARGLILRGSIGRRLAKIGEKCGKTSVQVALNWLISKESVVAIPKAAQFEHIEEIAGSVGWRLEEGLESLSSD